MVNRGTQPYIVVVVIQLLCHVQLFVTSQSIAHQASLSFTISWSLHRFVSVESVMQSNHLVLCRPLLLLPSIFPSTRVLSNESAVRIRWPKYWSFRFSISLSNEHPGLISFRMDWLDLPAVQGTLKSLLQHHSSKASILQHSDFFMVQLSHPYMTTGKAIALMTRTFVIKVMSLLFNILSRFVYPFSPKLPSRPGCHAALSRVACVVQQDFVIRFKYSSVHMAIPNSLAIPPPNSSLLLRVWSFSKTVSLFTERNRSTDLRELPSFLTLSLTVTFPRGAPLFLGHICMGWFLITVYLISSYFPTLRNPRWCQGNQNWKRHVYSSVHCSIVYNSQDMEAT